MEHRSDPIPAALRARRSLDDIAGTCRHIELSAGRVGEIDAVKGTKGVELVVDHPLIVAEWPGDACDRCRESRPKHGRGTSRREQGHMSPVAGVDHDRMRGAGDDIDRRVAPLPQPDRRSSPGGGQRLRRRDRHGRSIDRPSQCLPFSLRQRREWLEQQHGAAGEPQGEDQARYEPEPPVEPDQLPDDGVVPAAPRSGRGCFPQRAEARRAGPDRDSRYRPTGQRTYPTHC